MVLQVNVDCKNLGGASGKESTGRCRRQEMRVQSLGWKDLLEEGMATHSSILAWRIPMDRGAWQATIHGVTEESDTTELLSTHTQCVFKVYGMLL